MFSRKRGCDKKSVVKEKLECKCVNVAINEKQDEKNDKLIAIECSSQPGLCVVDDSGLCTKDENAPHCSLSPVEYIGELCTTVSSLEKTADYPLKEKCCGQNFHSYKIDINNAEDTGLVADKQCQTCGPLCSPATCSTRSREFYISWDKKRTSLFITLVLAFILWICIYVSITNTSS